jgi:hypothetical protein
MSVGDNKNWGNFINCAQRESNPGPNGNGTGAVTSTAVKRISTDPLLQLYLNRQIKGTPWAGSPADGIDTVGMLR